MRRLKSSVHFFYLDGLFQQNAYNPIFSKKKIANDLTYIPLATPTTMPDLHGYFNSGILESSSSFFIDASANMNMETINHID